MRSMDDVETWPGRTLYDRGGNKIGAITDIYYVDGSGQPDWMTVRTARLGSGGQLRAAVRGDRHP